MFFGSLLFFSTNLSQSVIVRCVLHVSCSFDLFTFAFSTSLSQSVTVRYDLHVSCSFDLFTFAFSTSLSQSVTVRYDLRVSCSFNLFGAGIAQLVVLGLAAHSVAGSILLWGLFR